MLKGTVHFLIRRKGTDSLRRTKETKMFSCIFQRWSVQVSKLWKKDSALNFAKLKAKKVFRQQW